MGHWNHRIIRHVCAAYTTNPGEDRFELQEVFYGTPAEGDYMHGAVSLHGRNRTAIRDTIVRLEHCIRKPALNCKCDANKEAK
jgi:hypothetical protein